MDIAISEVEVALQFACTIERMCLFVVCMAVLRSEYDVPLLCVVVGLYCCDLDWEGSCRYESLLGDCWVFKLGGS